MALLAQDEFTRANAATLGQDWTTISGEVQSLAILNNGVAANVAENEGNAYTGRNIIWPADNWAELKFPTLVGATGQQGIMLRGVDNSNYYGGGIDPGNRGSNNVLIWKVVAGVWTQLADLGSVLVAGSVVRFGVRGVNLELYVNGVIQLTVADNALNAEKAPGMGLMVPAISTVYFTNWFAGDYLETKNQPPNNEAIGGYSVS